MQYWLFAFKWYHGNLLIAKCDPLEEAKIQRDKLDKEEFEYADIIKMEWGKQPILVSSMSFEYEKGKTIVKRRIKNEWW